MQKHARLRFLGGPAALVLALTVLCIESLVGPSAARAQSSWVPCKVDYVGETTTMVVVHCAGSTGAYQNFGVGKTDAAYLARLMSAAMAALLSGREMSFRVDASESNRPAGCTSDICSPFTGWHLN